MAMLFNLWFILYKLMCILSPRTLKRNHMKPWRKHLPLLVTVLLSGAALVHGPIAQLPDYHDFADQTRLFGIPHFADVFSNLGFALVALWGLVKLTPSGRHSRIENGWAGYRLFLMGLLLTAIGSSYYHLDPDNARLVWDRLPIALACGGLLAGVWGDTRQRSSTMLAAFLGVSASPRYGAPAAHPASAGSATCRPRSRRAPPFARRRRSPSRTASSARSARGPRPPPHELRYGHRAGAW